MYHVPLSRANHVTQLTTLVLLFCITQATAAVTLGHWGQWSACTDLGTRIRTRTCHASHIGSRCTGKTSQMEPCTGAHWAPWSDWGVCTIQGSTACDQGSRARVRHCENGTTCVGDIFQQGVCTVPSCSIDGGWGVWSMWSACNATCGEGHQFRARPCNNPSPVNSGAYCPGNTLDTQECKLQECPIDGGWSNFTARPCTKTCGVGLLASARKCDSPAPQFGGKQCNGSSIHFAKCVLAPCVINGGWSAWSNYTACEVICGEGDKKRTRYCNSPPPQHGGLPCNGSATERQECNNGNCPADIRRCDKHKVMDAILHSTSVSAPDALPCDNSTLGTPEALLMTSCGAPADTSSWKLGVEVLKQCETIPLYVPVGHIDRVTKYKQYGVLMDCAETSIQIASQSCSARTGLKTIRRDDESADLHVLFW